VILSVVGAGFLVAASVFFLAGTLGVLRFPDASSRLRAVTKADNLGLGLLVVGLAMFVTEPVWIMKMIVVWVLVLLSSTTVAQLIARVAQHAEGRVKGDADDAKVPPGGRGKGQEAEQKEGRKADRKEHGKEDRDVPAS
jgi:multicomponent Na+:H+ antiporter subunit G